MQLIELFKNEYIFITHNQVKKEYFQQSRAFWIFLPNHYPLPTSHASMQSLSHVQLCVTLWTVARQAPLFLGFSRQEYWSG